MNWDQIVEDLGPRLYRYFCARFSDVMADDLTQETLLRLVRKCQSGDYDTTRGTIAMYAFGIAHFVSLESKGERMEESLSALEEQGYDFVSDVNLENDYLTQERLLHVRKCLAKLKPIEQQIIALSIDDELTIPQISILVSLPPGTIKSHLHRAKNRLIELVKNEVPS